MVEEQARVHVYDPQVSRESMFAEFKYTLNLSEETKPGLGELVVTSPDAYSAAAGAHAIAIATEWDEFKTLDYKKIYDSMAKPAFLFDGRNIVDAAALREIGFTVAPSASPWAGGFPPPFPFSAGAALKLHASAAYYYRHTPAPPRASAAPGVAAGAGRARRGRRRRRLLARAHGLRLPA